MHGEKARQFHTSLRQSYLELKKFLSNPDKPYVQPPTEYKRYYRAETITLPARTDVPASVSKTISNRSTAKQFADTEVTLQELATLLDTAVGLRNRSDETDTHRQYPSGGALYPIELYLSIKADVVDTVPPGLYHYNVKDHMLEKVGAEEELEQARNAMNLNNDVPMTLTLAAAWDKNMHKYQDFGYKIIMLEAGHMAQNIILTGEGLGLQSWPFVHFDEAGLNRALDLDKRGEEDVIYCIGIGRPIDETTQSQPQQRR